jgi:6-methylsalicylate decarboxylase
MASINRLNFVAGLAAGAGLAVVPGIALPQSPGRIDVHHHYAPPNWLAQVNQHFPDVAGIWKGWSTERALEQMDRGGVQKSMLSMTTPGLTFSADPAATRRLTRECNEYAAQMAAAHPGRFGIFVALPLPDIQASLAEVAYGLDTLKAAGVGLFTSYGNKWLGDPVYAPLFEELNRRRAIVFVHPTSNACCADLLPGITDADIEYAADTTRAITRMIFSGSSRRYPNMRIIWSHAGGAMPYLDWRFEREAKKAVFKDVLPNGFLPEAQRFYYDTAQTSIAAPMAALMKIVPRSQVLFGTDYPYITASDTADGLHNCGVFNDQDLVAIGRSNAVALLGS